jgi:large subunit ribosomal protein L7/L12
MAAPARTASRRAGALARAFAASSRRGDAVALADARRAFGALARPARPVASTLAPSQSTSSSRLSIRGFAADAEPASSESGADPDDDRVVDLDREEFPDVSPRVIRLADDICSLTLLEVHDMTQILTKRLGLQPGGMPMMMPGAAGAAGAAPAAGGAAPAAAPAEEQTEFAVKLEGFDAAQKIKVIKEVRAVTELGLKEAKDLVEGAPAVLKKGLKKEDAEAIKEKIEKVGGKVVLE